ncbi:hypothetical protein Lesp02_35870 [Lentzea sp. NBRC 105346]|uniref:hypothetical protein n=1 Tax=Lentzea sp. NBRC 105346 TaxID=3032205 RepID=UPI0024A4F8FE|nr:hypothetical protein [Lentzea sp. NBRC 105346]GLZ31399.1 hypothetical protein Lesp02_35870 [Lentzea sp. NBRC 105346]
MKQFVDAALSFPTLWFSVAVVVMVAFWLVAAFGAVEIDDVAIYAVPVSLWVLLSWFASLVGSSYLNQKYLVIAIAITAGAAATALVMKPVRKLLGQEILPSRNDFVGRLCVIRTKEVTEKYGQAEVTADDGSSAVIQVRHNGNKLSSGSTALIFDYDDAGEFFWVVEVN